MAGMAAPISTPVPTAAIAMRRGRHPEMLDPLLAWSEAVALIAGSFSEGLTEHLDGKRRVLELEGGREGEGCLLAVDVGDDAVRLSFMYWSEVSKDLLIVTIAAQFVTSCVKAMKYSPCMAR
jgi:hypothetical protein